MNYIWPLKTGEDERFHKSAATGSIYDSIGEMPRYDSRTELRRYQESKLRRGLIENCLPTVCYGSIVGCMFGLAQSKTTLRHMTRTRVIFTHTVSCGGVSLAVASFHHFLIVVSEYKQQGWQAMAAGMIGGTGWSLMTSSNPQKATIGGFFIGLFYYGCWYISSMVQEKTLNNFLITQQSLETPIHRVAPELQPLYRAWLWDNRPIEDSDELRRRALLLERSANDTRLDAASFIAATDVTKWFDWCPEFPEWWPLKFAKPTEKEILFRQRQRDDAFERRLTSIQSPEGEYLTDYAFRSKKHLNPKQEHERRG